MESQTFTISHIYLRSPDRAPADVLASVLSSMAGEALAPGDIEVGAYDLARLRTMTGAWAKSHGLDPDANRHPLPLLCRAVPPGLARVRNGGVA